MSNQIPSTGVLVTRHALERARERYGLINLDVGVIHADVCDALLAGRASKLHPFIGDYECVGNAVFVWSEDAKRVYVVEGQRRAYRRGFLKVVTAIPGSRRIDLDEELAA